MTTPDALDGDVAQVRARVDAAKDRASRQAAELEVAERDLTRHLVTLSEEFGVSSLDEARALLAKVDGELRAEVDRIIEQLEIAEGGAS